MGSATVQGQLWGTRPRDWTEVIEPLLRPIHLATMAALAPLSGLSLLDAGCGTGLALQLAVERGARASGLDASAALLDVARGRLPDADLRVGDPSDHVGLLGVIAAEAAFTDADPWLDALLTLLDENRSLLSERLTAELPGIRWTPPQASFIAWLDCRGLGLGDDPAAAFLRQGVALSPGLAYGAAGAGFTRLNFGTSQELVTEIVRRIAQALPR